MTKTNGSRTISAPKYHVGRPRFRPRKQAMVNIKKSRTAKKDSATLQPCWKQGCGSGTGSGLDPYSIGSVDPDPYSESGSGSRRAKMTHKSRQ